MFISVNILTAPEVSKGNNSTPKNILRMEVARKERENNDLLLTFRRSGKDDNAGHYRRETTYTQIRETSVTDDKTFVKVTHNVVENYEDKGKSKNNDTLICCLCIIGVLIVIIIWLLVGT